MWELSQNRKGYDKSYPEAVKKYIRTANLIGTNVLAYATGRELKDKLDRQAFPDEAGTTLAPGRSPWRSSATAAATTTPPSP